MIPLRRLVNHVLIRCSVIPSVSPAGPCTIETQNGQFLTSLFFKG